LRQKGELPIGPIAVASFAQMGRPGIYLLHLAGEVVYVGQAVNMRRRVSNHIGEGVKEFDAVSFIPCDLDALGRLERAYIRKLIPRYNQCSLTKSLRDRYGADSHAENAEPADSPFMGASKAAAFLGVSPADFFQWVSDRRGPRIKRWGRSRLKYYDVSDLRDFALANAELIAASKIAQ
jgi:hypothetical protein